MSAGSTFSRADGHPVVVLPDAGRFARLHERLKERVPLWVVYRPITRQYPGKWCARMHVCLPFHRSTRFVVLHDTLAELVDLLPPGLERLDRNAADPPEIEETWI